MLPFKVRQQFKALLVDIGKQEKQLEVLRQILCEQYDFEPYSAFQRLDVDRKGFLTPLDIYYFLNDNDINITESEASQYIRQYSAEGNDQLAYPEFLPSLLPLDNPDLRTLATQRKVYPVKPGEILPYEVEYALARIISKEIASYHHLEPYKQDLVAQPGFDYKDAFHSLDPHNNTGLIDFSSLRDFFKANAPSPPENDMIAILRRIDKDGDGKISYEELVEAIKPIDSEDQRHRAEINVQESFGVANQHRSPQGSESQRSHQKQEGFNSSKGLTGSMNKSKTPEELRATLKRSIMGELRRDVGGKQREGDLLEALLRVLREMVYLEREVEVAKEDLALKSDFNLFDAFRLFDKEGNGTISAGEIELGLNNLGLYPSKDQLYLLVRKFDRDSDTILSFCDMCEGFIPMQEEYIKLLKSRTPHCGEGFVDVRRVFGQQTLKQMKALYALHLENESIVEALRQKLARDPRFDTHRVFDLLDRDQDGFITIYELREIMEKYDMFITDKDLQYLINRFDKDAKEKISYIEFIQEITPKSPQQV